MDRDAKAALIKWRLESARDDLETARVDLDAGKFRGAVNRAYYTVFHVTSAILTWHDAERARHSGVHSTFGELLIKTGLIEPEYGKIYTNARRIREEHDYKPPLRPLTHEEVTAIILDAERFVARMERYLREAGALDNNV